ncbi:MAG TPA: thioredoxin domain-containing protein [Candidatus Angelobacter sp.]|jgi:protein-disulfide isomerase|nr:thioredoxin domain-containing protein [Candidatus Angelobacter sp.]
MKVRLNWIVISVFTLGLSTSSSAADASLLKPPRGAKVAVVMFEDLQCPECARAYAVVLEAASAHRIPVVLHDFPLPMHNWAFDAAVWARYFDKTSRDMGNDFRKFIYANQIQITQDNLQQWVQKFAGENKTAVVPVPDPDRKLAEQVRADYLLGQRIGVEHTPTIWVVSNRGVSQPLVEDVKVREKLGPMIEDILSKVQPVAAVEVNSAPKAGRKKITVKTPKKAG